MGAGLLKWRGATCEKVTRKCMTNKYCLMRFVVHTQGVSGDKSCPHSHSPLSGFGEEDTFISGNFLYRWKFPLQKRNLCPALRQKGESRELLLCLLFFNCLQPKIISYAKVTYFGV